MYQKLKYVVENGIANITLNRPEVFNAFDDELSYELQSALKESAKNNDVTGTGNKRRRKRLFAQGRI